jgi:hypothetical protein
MKRIAVSRLILGVAGLFAIAHTALAGEPIPPAVHWLMSDPLNMLDWGLYNANKAADEAVKYLNDREAEGAKWNDSPLNKGKDFLESKNNVNNIVPLHQLGYAYAIGWA